MNPSFHPHAVPVYLWLDRRPSLARPGQFLNFRLHIVNLQVPQNEHLQKCIKTNNFNFL